MMAIEEKKEDKNTFSVARLESVMQIQGVSYKEINSELGYDIERLIHSTKTVPLNVVGKLASILNCSKDYLMRSDNDPHTKPILPDAEAYAKPKSKGQRTLHEKDPDKYMEFNLDLRIVTKLERIHGWSDTSLNDFVGEQNLSFSQITYAKALPKSIMKTNFNNLCNLLQCDPEYIQGKSSHIDSAKIPPYVSLAKQNRLVFSDKFISLSSDQIARIAKRCKIPKRILNTLKNRRLRISEASLKRLTRAYNEVCIESYMMDDMASIVGASVTSVIDYSNKKDATLHNYINIPKNIKSQIKEQPKENDVIIAIKDENTKENKTMNNTNTIDLNAAIKALQDLASNQKTEGQTIGQRIDSIRDINKRKIVVQSIDALLKGFNF